MDGSLRGAHPVASPHLNRIGTAVPQHDVHRAFVDFAASLLPAASGRVFLRMAERAGIAHRFSHLRPAPSGSPALDTGGFYRRDGFPGTAARMAAYEAHATGLALDAISRAEIDPAEITHIVVASCTGFTAPGLDQRIAERLGLGRGVERTLIGFMGCYAAVPTLRTAWHIVRSDPTARVLTVNLELCTIHLQQTADLETILSFLLFGDGCAAGLVTADPVGICLDRFRSAALPGSGDLITWRIGDSGFDMHLSGRVPQAIAAALRAERARNDGTGLLADLPDPVRHWAVHAGGRSVLDAVEQSLELGSDALAHSRAVLHDVGNISSATLPFVLERMLREGTPGPGVAMAFGPGLAAETFRFRVL